MLFSRCSVFRDIVLMSWSEGRRHPAVWAKNASGLRLNHVAFGLSEPVSYARPNSSQSYPHPCTTTDWRSWLVIWLQQVTNDSSLTRYRSTPATGDEPFHADFARYGLLATRWLNLLYHSQISGKMLRIIELDIYRFNMSFIVLLFGALIRMLTKCI